MREGPERCGSPGFNPQPPRLESGRVLRGVAHQVCNPQAPRWPTDCTGMYPVPAPSRAYHPCFTRDSVQAILVVPQGRALVNSKPYPARLFFWRGRPSTDAPGVQISMRCVKSGAPPHQLNRRRYGAGTLSLAFQGERPVAYPRNTSGVQSPNDKQHKTTHRLAVG